MPRRLSPLPVQILSFLLGTLLAVALGVLTNRTGDLPWGLEFLRKQALPLAGITMLLIIGVLIWQYRVEQHPALPARLVWDLDRPPFPGLEAFTELDSAVFFGRDAEISELSDRLHPVVEARAHRMIAVIGPSGAGKSSLIHAGVVPRLRQRRGRWIVVPPVMPGERPLASLAQALTAAWPAHCVTEVPTTRFPDHLRTAHRSPNAPVLLIVDQAEELITLSGETERDEFLGLLAGALDTDSRLWIILVLRSEFLTAFLTTEQAWLFRDPIIVGTLSREALLEVIEKPAHRAGLAFDPPTLPQRIAADTGGGDALPLLAYAMQELCLVAGSEGVLTADAYERIGGVTGVLTRQADKVAAELGGVDPAGPVLSTLLEFVTIGENEPTRRRVRRSALSAGQRQVAEAFIAARLLTTDADGDDAILDVAHEALFRTWVPLRQAIEASIDQLRWRADLERWARDWDNSGRQNAYLLRDERLKAAQRWGDADADMVANLSLVAEFLACSNRADRATMERLSETIARQALAVVDRDPDHSLLLALTAFEECAPTALALRALTTALVASSPLTVLDGHEEGVLQVAWSPDGQWLATTSSDRTARIWDTSNGNELAVLRGHGDWIRGVAWSPDGRRLATGSVDRTVRIWDPAHRSELAVLSGHHDDVWGVAWSPDGRQLASASRDNTARIWNVETISELMVLHGHEDQVWCVAWSPDGRQLATGSLDRTARIWDAETGRELLVLRGHEGWVPGVAWSPDGQQLATASYDRTARIWDSVSGNELVVIHGHDNNVEAVAWSPDGQQLATGSLDTTARIWDAKTGRELAVLRGHKETVPGVAWSSDSQRLATASDRPRIWCTRDTWELAVLYGHNDEVREIAWSPDGRWLATASCDRTARIWDGESSRELAVLCGHNDEVWCVAWSPDGRRLATASRDRTARIWDAESSRELAVLCGHNDEVWCVAWSPDGRRLATASYDWTTRIWDAESSRELAVLPGHDNWVWCVAWSPDSRRLAMGSRDRTTRICDIDKGNELAVLHGHDHWISAVAWSPDGRRLATASRDQTARIWDPESSRELAVLRGHEDWVRGVSWSPDGRRLVSASHDQTARIWDAESGRELVVVGAHATGVESVAWSPDDKRIASAALDGTCRIWDATISIENFVTNARRRVSRQLLPQERHDLMLPMIVGD